MTGCLKIPDLIVKYSEDDGVVKCMNINCKLGLKV
jgi:hypothetical protein